MKLDKIFFLVILTCTFILSVMSILVWKNVFIGLMFLCCAIVEFNAIKQCD